MDDFQNAKSYDWVCFNCLSLSFPELWHVQILAEPQSQGTNLKIHWNCEKKNTQQELRFFPDLIKNIPRTFPFPTNPEKNVRIISISIIPALAGFRRRFGRATLNCRNHRKCDLHGKRLRLGTHYGGGRLPSPKGGVEDQIHLNWFTRATRIKSAFRSGNETCPSKCGGLCAVMVVKLRKAVVCTFEHDLRGENEWAFARKSSACQNFIFWFFAKKSRKEIWLKIPALEWIWLFQARCQELSWK